jgi:hypothetical protein
MIEENGNIDEVTMRRQQELARAKASYQRAVSEGRLAVRPRQGVAAQLAGAQERDPPGVVAASASLSDVSAAEVQPVETMPQPKDPEVAWRHTRLAITAGLVVLLLVIWIWQKRAGR